MKQHMTVFLLKLKTSIVKLFNHLNFTLGFLTPPVSNKVQRELIGFISGILVQIFLTYLFIDFKEITIWQYLAGSLLGAFIYINTNSLVEDFCNRNSLFTKNKNSVLFIYIISAILSIIIIHLIFWSVDGFFLSTDFNPVNSVLDGAKPTVRVNLPSLKPLEVPTTVLAVSAASIYIMKSGMSPMCKAGALTGTILGSSAITLAKDMGSAIADVYRKNNGTGSGTNSNPSSMLESILGFFGFDYNLILNPTLNSVNVNLTLLTLMILILVILNIISFNFLVSVILFKFKGYDVIKNWLSRLNSPLINKYINYLNISSTFNLIMWICVHYYLMFILLYSVYILYDVLCLSIN